MTVQRLGVMQVIDTLMAAGAERVAVNLANRLPRDRYRSYLCTTREDGPLDSAVVPDVGRLRLERRASLDISAVKRLVGFVRENNIGVLHAHSSALFIARATAAFYPHPSVIWHAHYGRYADNRRPLLYRLATIGVDGVITVSQQLADWSVQRLRVPAGSTWYIKNLTFPAAPETGALQLPGLGGFRIVCVANFRPEKDHFTLLRAMSAVIQAVPQAHLILAGKCNDAAYFKRVQTGIPAMGLEQHVTIVGERHDIPAILRECDIAVLSSMSEGLPMSLLEYGMAGMPTVATDAGQCPEVLDQGRAGILVPSGNAERLAGGLIDLLQNREKRQTLGRLFHNYVNDKFNPDRIIEQVCCIYDAASGHGSRPERDLVGSIG